MPTGLDVSLSFFYQQCRDFVYDDFTVNIFDFFFFTNGHLPGGFAATSIALIPKRNGKCRLSEF